MKVIQRIADISKKINGWLILASGSIILLMCFYTTGDVTGRYLFNKPLPAAYEATLMLLIFITYFGVAHVQARGGHMRLGFLWERSGPRGRAVLDIIAVLVGLFVFGIVAWEGWLLAVHSWTSKESTMGAYVVPLYPARFGLAVGTTLLVFQYIIDLIRHIGQLFTNTPEEPAANPEVPVG